MKIAARKLATVNGMQATAVYTLVRPCTTSIYIGTTNVIAAPRTPTVNIDSNKERSGRPLNASSETSGVPPPALTLRDHKKKALMRSMPQTITRGAGDRCNKLNGALGRASSAPQWVRLLQPTPIRNIAMPTSNRPTLSILALDRTVVGRSLPLKR